MSTGNFTDWNGAMADLGPLYPFVGWEVLMVIVLLVAWVVWHIMQITAENRTHEEQARMLRQGDNLQKAPAGGAHDRAHVSLALDRTANAGGNAGVRRYGQDAALASRPESATIFSAGSAASARSPCGRRAAAPRPGCARAC